VRFHADDRNRAARGAVNPVKPSRRWRPVFEVRLPNLHPIAFREAGNLVGGKAGVGWILRQQKNRFSQFLEQKRLVTIERSICEFPEKVLPKALHFRDAHPDHESCHAPA
jgi:hypothetical protein